MRLGVCKGLFIVCLIGIILQSLEWIDATTSIMGVTMELKESLVTLPFYAVGTIVFGIMTYKIKKDIYKDVEERLDD